MGLSGSQALCASQLLAPCPSIQGFVCAALSQSPCPFPGVPGNNYARPDPTTFALHMPPAQTTMPDPCAGVPTNAFCSTPATTVLEFPIVAGPAGALALLAAAGLFVRRRRGHRGRLLNTT
jgi:MYXO-CTERM domain-containing protein